MKLGITPYIFDENGNIDYKAHSECGFSSIDLQYFTNPNNNVFALDGKRLANWCKSELAKAKEAGVSINQLHSFWVWPPQPYDKDKKSRIDELVYYKRAIRAAHLLECKYVAIHHRVPLPFEDLKLNEEAYKTTIDFMKMLVPYSRKYGITLCLENLPFPQPVYDVSNTLSIVKSINSKYVQMCLDTGHANITDKDVSGAVKLVNQHLKIFHVHDNDGMHDNHWLPGKGTINWKEFGKALKDIKFKSVLSLETCPNTDISNDEKKKLLKELHDSVIDNIGYKQ